MDNEEPGAGDEEQQDVRIHEMEKFMYFNENTGLNWLVLALKMEKIEPFLIFFFISS